MDETIEQLVSTLIGSRASNVTLENLSNLFNEQTSESLSLFISNSLESLITIEHWAWKILSSKKLYQWIEDGNYTQLFHALTSFNMKLVFNNNNIEIDTKEKLLIPPNIAWIDGIFELIVDDEDAGDVFLTIVNYWFDVLSYLSHEHPQFASLSIIKYINERMAKDILMSKEYILYLKQLRDISPDSIFTAKQIFYLKTCSFSLNVHLILVSPNFIYTGEQIIKYLLDDYLSIIEIHSYTVESWSPDLLGCITHLIRLICSCCFWNDEKAKHIKMIISTDDISYDHIFALIRIISHESFYHCISSQWSNDETILIDSTLIFLLCAIETQDLGCYMGSETILPKTLISIAQTSEYGRICICAYGLLANILSDAQIKELKISDNIFKFLFHFLEQAWKHPTKKYRKVPIPYLLQVFLSLSNNDSIQIKTANANKLPLLIELCDQYPMVFDVLWGLSFHPAIQKQLRLNQSFMTKLTKLIKNHDDEKIRKTINGILWNLNPNHDENTLSETGDNTTFDIMISYSHEEKDLCKQIYDELIHAGYQVWIDFDQMHGNVMDAMAQAIERSRIIIICMSEHYRRSNYCRAEAQYAFQRQLKIVPIVLQKHYKPDGWVLFLIGQLLYINFTKYEFPRAIEMLIKEIKAVDPNNNTSKITTQYKDDSAVLRVTPSCSPLSLPPSQPVISSQPTENPENVRDWTRAQVREWLLQNNLPQMADVLADIDGLSLIYLSQFMMSSEPQQILTLLHRDSLRRTSQSVSMIELSLFRSLIERNNLASLAPARPITAMNIKEAIDTNKSSSCCNLM